MNDEFGSVQAVTTQAKPRSGLSLRARAVGLLSRREHSRVELSRKLSTHAQSPEELSALLDALAKEGWQSDQRFVQGFVHRKAGQQGLAKIAQELTQQGIEATQVAQVRLELKDSELERAQSVWQKKFSVSGPPQNTTEYARQGRFLASRGFSHEVIHRVLKNPPEFES
jgi:regulatory protein